MLAFNINSLQLHRIFLNFTSNESNFTNSRKFSTVWYTDMKINVIKDSRKKFLN